MANTESTDAQVARKNRISGDGVVSALPKNPLWGVCQEFSSS